MVVMIRVIRFDGMEILLNTQLIESVEKTPETVVTLTTGDRIRLKSSLGDVMQKIDSSRFGVREEDRKDRKDKKEKIDKKDKKRPERK
jgi:flagellar protein FlbD